jgi:hypothetical protein
MRAIAGQARWANMLQSSAVLAAVLVAGPATPRISIGSDEPKPKDTLPAEKKQHTGGQKRMPNLMGGRRLGNIAETPSQESNRNVELISSPLLTYADDQKPAKAVEAPKETVVAGRVVNMLDLPVRNAEVGLQVWGYMVERGVLLNRHDDYRSCSNTSSAWRT